MQGRGTMMRAAAKTATRISAPAMGGFYLPPCSRRSPCGPPNQGSRSVGRGNVRLPGRAVPDKLLLPVFDVSDEFVDGQVVTGESRPRPVDAHGDVLGRQVGQGRREERAQWDLFD